MKQLHSIIIHQRKTKVGPVRHLAIGTGPKGGRTFWSLCGIGGRKESEVVEVDSKHGYESTRICHNCIVARRNRDVDTILPEVDETAAARGRAILDGGSVRVIRARVYRVEGSVDTYTVTVPADPDYATLCNCMAAKTHPESMCKHQAAVILAEAAEVGQ